MTNRIFLLVALLISCVCRAESSKIVYSADLDDHNRLVVSNTEHHTVSVAIYFGDESEQILVEQFVVGNAVTYVENVVELELDNSNSTVEFVVTINNRTSNYGATTGVVAYKGSWWHLKTIPDEKFVVHLGKSGRESGIEIYGNVYQLRHGLFTLGD